MRAWVTGLGLVGLIGLAGLAGCDERSRSRVDGTDDPEDAGALDLGADDGAPPDAAPVVDRGPDIAEWDAAVEAGLDMTPVDMALDAAPPLDARPMPDGPLPDLGPFTEEEAYDRATNRPGRLGCPRISLVNDAFGWRWHTSAIAGRLGTPFGAEWVDATVDLMGEARNPVYIPDLPGLRIEALRPGPDDPYGLWRIEPDDTLHIGYWDRGWVDTGLAVHGPPVDRPDAFDRVQFGSLSATLLPADGRLVLVLHPNTLAPPQVIEWPVDDVSRARLAADDDGLFVAWTAGGALEVRALAFDGGPRWSATLPVSDPEFDIALRPGRVGLTFMAGDDRLSDRPFAGSYGAPQLAVLHGADGAPLWQVPLHPDPILGASPALGATEDGWLAAWVRLRVDGDRNRTEIEAARVADGRADPPLRITRAHGFSFCPAVSDAVAGHSLIAWLDTRFSTEDILVAHLDDSRWRGPDRPEPSPAPPDFPAGCADSIAAVEGPVQSFDAVPYGGGFHTVWVDEAGVLTAGSVDPEDGPRVGWRLPDGPRPTGVRLALAPIGGVLFGEVDGRVRAWRTMPPPEFEDAPRVPQALDVDLDAPLHDVAGGRRVVAVVGDPPTLVGIEPAGEQRVLPEGAVDPQVLVVEDAVIVAWLVERAGTIDLMWLRLTDGLDWADAPVSTRNIRELVEPSGLQLIERPEGWTALFDAHAGRAFARRIVGSTPDARGVPQWQILDLDPAKSTGPVGHRDGALWLEERPVERFQVHFVAGDAAGTERLPIDGPRRARFFLDVADGDPIVLWLAGANARIARFGPDCRLPAASEP